ncbi:MAG: hypothetical protein PUG09_01360 [Prevotella sp.]|nr:hypothetical protein [Prevotella sp.]
MNTNEIMQQLINAEMKKGTRLVVEVDDVLGKDLVSINVSMNGSALSLLKMLISAMAINKKLKQFVKTAAAADEVLSVEAIKLNVDKAKEEGGEV